MVDWTEHESLARDTQRLRQVLQPQLPEGIDVEACELLSLKLVEDLSGDDDDGLLTCYRVGFVEAATGTRGVQLYAGHMVTNARELFAAHASRPLAAPVCGLPLIFLPEMDMVLFAFPNDARLLLLGDCVSRAALDACIAKAPDFAGCSVVESAYEVLRYEPDRACTLRFTVVLERDGVRRPHRLIAKTRIDGSSLHIENLTRLWESLPLRSGNWTLPRPHFYDAERRLSWESTLEGEPFWNVYPNLATVAVFEQMASALADLHHNGLAAKKKDAEPALAAASEPVAAIDPQLGARQAEVLRWLAESQPTLKSVDVSLHGDFRPDVFLIDGPRVGLVHFGPPILGDPARDLGRFASHVHAAIIASGLDAAPFDEALEAFHAEYARCSAPWSGMRAVCWHTAAELAGRCVTESIALSEDRGKIERLITLAEAYVKRMDVEELKSVVPPATSPEAS